MAEEEKEVVQPEIEETEETPEGETEEEAVEGEEPEAEEAEGEEGEAEESSSDRRARRTQTLANRAREAELEIARLKGENEALKKPAPAADQGEAARVRAEKLALMDPAERKTFELEETVQRLQQGQALTSLQIQDATDQARYDAKSTLNPIYAKHKETVESALADMRRKGTNAPREEVLAWIVGKAALTAKPSKAAKAAAAERTKAVVGKPVSARGDAGGKKKGDGESLAELEERFRGVQI